MVAIYADCECDRCHKIIPKNHAHETTVEKKEGRSSGSFSVSDTFLGGRSAPSIGYSRGRTYYVTHHVWLCNECHALKLREENQRTLVRFAVVGLIALFFGMIYLVNTNNPPAPSKATTASNTAFQSPVFERPTALPTITPAAMPDRDQHQNDNLPVPPTIKPELPPLNVNRCDELAANPNDPRKATPGVPFSQLKIQSKDALDACTTAVASAPNELRFQYQLARALEFSDRPKAFAIHSNLVKLRYPASYDNLGWMFYSDMKNVAQAVNLFGMGVELGDPDSMVSLSDMIDRGSFNPPNAINLKLSLLKRAGELGHQGASEAYKVEVTKLQPQAPQDPLKMRPSARSDNRRDPFVPQQGASTRPEGTSTCYIDVATGRRLCPP